MGLVVPLYDNAEAAHEHDGAESVKSVEAITNVPLYFTHLARHGYASGLLNAQLPVFFCTDEASELQFLRLHGGGQGKVEMDILESAGNWSAYEGAEEIEFLDNREACDELLASELFTTLAEAKYLVERWRLDYNTERPHSSLGDSTPAEFASRSSASGCATLRHRPRSAAATALNPES